MKRRWAGLGAGVVALGTLGGCCCMKVKAPAPLPAPISLLDQLRIINERAEALPRLRAKGTVVLRYVNDQGHPKQDSADGTLLLRQRYGAAAANDPADVALWGRVAGQEIFQAAKNQEKWWFIRRDIKTGWTGDVEGTADFSGNSSGGVMRADLMLQVLAITEIVPHVGETIAMRVRDDTRSNNVMILRLWGNGTGWVKREIIVDRDSGEVRQVNLCDPAGRLAAQAELKDYQPVAYQEGEAAPKGAKPAKFPRDIRIFYPAQKLDIHFTIDEAVLLTEIPEAAFATPDFAAQDIKNGDTMPK